MALKLNPTILKAGRLIGYGSIHSNLNCITLAVIKSINYEESSVQTVDIDEYNMDNCRVQSHSWNNLFIIAPVITIDLDDGTSELKQYALFTNCQKHDLTLFTNCQKKTIDGHVWNMMSTKPRHWSYNEKYHKAVQQWLVAANRLKTRKQCFDFLCITN
eukprot:108436_1